MATEDRAARAAGVLTDLLAYREFLPAIAVESEDDEQRVDRYVESRLQLAID